MTNESTYRSFIGMMNKVLEENGFRSQKETLEELFKFEDRFREALISTLEGREMYQTFMDFIIKEKCNILSSRVYFRERQNVFSAKISPAFQKQTPALLYRFRINYMFARWVIDRYHGPKIRSLRYSYDKIVAIRKFLCENNLPLALNRAKIFWSKVPNSHLEYMDIVQTSSEGLLTAIDKFVPPYKSLFRSVAIGRMTLNMITDHNATVVKLSPIEKRILYRANNARVKAGLVDINEILEYVRESFRGVSLKKLEEIINAATSVVELDLADRVNHTDIGRSVARAGESNTLIMATDAPNPEEICLKNDIIKKMVGYLPELRPIEEKVLRMKVGLDFDE